MIEVAIFSYNRHFYLKNALHSVQRNVSDVRVRIYDDGSDQSEMKKFLAENSDLVGARLKGLDSKHGGLYTNMQSALDEAQEDYLLLMQDDTQIVRKMEREDLEAINRAFEVFPTAAFLSVMFLKGEKSDVTKEYCARMVKTNCIALSHSKTVLFKVTTRWFYATCHA